MTNHDASPRRQRRSLSVRILRWTGAVLAAVVALVTVMAVWPASTSGLRAEPEPTTTHDEAVARFAEVTAGEEGSVFEPCESRLLDHGKATDVVVVLFHGLTNCPEQFAEFGSELFEKGANVLILRAPRHGLANAAGDGIGGLSNIDGLTAGELTDFADTAIDIATGLGDDVRVLGLSMGGVLATWTAQERADVDRVVAVAPAMSIPRVPGFLTTGFVNLFDKVPGLDLPGESNLDHAYAGESTKGLVATFLLARFVERSAHDRGPAAADVVVVVNPHDNQVDNGFVTGFASSWGPQGVPVVTLPDQGLPHDVIDPDQPDGDTDLVYPILVDLLESGR
jgi:esterase/lipase